MANTEKSIYRSILQSSVWTVLMRWALRAIGLVSVMITARLLAKEDFGIVAQAAMVQALALSIFEMSAGMLLIRQSNPGRDEIDSAWTVMLLQGCMVGLLILALAYPISTYFEEPRLIPVLCLVALSSVLMGAQNIGTVLWLKDLDFRKDFVFNVTRRIVSSATAIGLALWLRNYYALVFGILAGAFIECAMSYWFHRYRPRFCLAHWRKYFSFGMTMIPMNIAKYIRYRVDQIVVGGTSSAAALGGYSVSSELSSSITQEIATPLARAFFPNFAAIAHDREKLNQVFLSVLGGVAFVVYPITTIISVNAADVIAVLLGSTWLDQAPLVRWLVIYGAAQGMFTLLTGSVLLVGGYERLSLKATWFQVFIIAPMAVVGAVSGGLMGVASAVTLTAVASIPFAAWILRKAYGITMRASLGALTRPAIACLSIPVFAYLLPMSGISSTLLRLVLSGTLAGIVYLTAQIVLWRVTGSPDGLERTVYTYARRRLAHRRS